MSVKNAWTLVALSALTKPEIVSTAKKVTSRWAGNARSNLAIVNTLTDLFLTQLDAEGTTTRKVDFFHLTLKMQKRLTGVSGAL